MKKLSSVHLFEKTTDECGSCGMLSHESSGCCHDEVKVVKLDQDLSKLPEFTYELQKIEQPVSVPSAFMVSPFESEYTPVHFQDHSPPLLSLQDTYLQINVFRI
ncbi:MAG: hypothetical protein IPH18_17375 [Chitinophagaceae bacterium]|nr:hypothetical protein [Chitinophagaceae bacterium]